MTINSCFNAPLIMQNKKIRQQFLDFFKERGHQFVPSAPVIPVGDATLLFTNAGMNQFKDIFIGERNPTYKRAVNSQKCIRVSGKHNDLEEVGRDTYHHTFFEMLGTWSFGDYYKKEAITWAWELFTAVWQLPKERLYATCYKSDQEAHDLWQTQTDIDPQHIMYFGDKENFWEMGDTGPCGPCSELHYDLGHDGCDKQGEAGHICQVNGNCRRFIELWNLVFIQFNRSADGNLTELKEKHVDTGAGFERICAVLQQKNSNYETDLFMPIISAIEKISGVAYQKDLGGMAHRAIADHIRMLTFAIADGVLPANDGRGYVLRRVLRRALRYGRQMGLTKPFIYKLVAVVAEVMGDIFPEVREKQAYVAKVIEAEEKSFIRTIDKGIELFEEAVKNIKDQKFSGAVAFKLYDTYGFPLDLTQLMAQEKNLTVDTVEFEKLMTEQKERARAGSLNTSKGIGGEIEVDTDNQSEKLAIARHHTATHLLHAALQQVLGTHATQAGSLVSPEKLRFDFNHFQALTKEELQTVERLVNEQIAAAKKLNISEKKYTEAKAAGAMSLFGEKYGDVVRVVEIPGFSKELCGGNHVNNTGELEQFKILKEASISAGVRRIEALAGKTNIAVYLQQQAKQLELEQKKEQVREVEKANQKKLLQTVLAKMDYYLAQKELINNRTVLLLDLGEANLEILRAVATSAVNALGSAAVVLAAKEQTKVVIVAKISVDLVAQGLSANVLVKAASAEVGGSGGGKPDMAQAGGKEPEKIGAALAAVRKLL